jgi:hypothetical protein
MVPWLGMYRTVAPARFSNSFWPCEALNLPLLCLPAPCRYATSPLSAVRA